MPASTASEILAVTPQTVRNWVRGGILSGRQALPDAPAGAIPDEKIDAEIEAVRFEHRARAADGR